MSCKQNQAWQHMFLILVLGKQKQVGPLSSMARQPSLLGEHQASERNCPQRKKGWMLSETVTQHCPLAFTCT